MQIHRPAVAAERLVYIAVANKKFNYTHGRSRIGYIGTTEKGADRIAQSAAQKSRELLKKHGVKSLEFFPVTCKPLQKVKTWRKLERGLLLRFREMHGVVPTCNHQGSKMKWTDEKDYFSADDLEAVIKKYS